MWFLFVLAFVVAYVVTVGLVQPVIERQLTYRCGNCSKGNTYLHRGVQAEPGVGHEKDALLPSILWPIALPYLLANYSTSPSLKRAKRAIDGYWTEKDLQEGRKALESMEREAGIR